MMKKRLKPLSRPFRNPLLRRNLRYNRLHRMSQNRQWLLLHPLQPQLSLLTPVPLNVQNMLSPTSTSPQA